MHSFAGYGIEDLCRIMAERGATVIGVDISNKLIEYGRAMYTFANQSQN